MNSKNQLRAWTNEWAALRSLKQSPLDEEVSRSTRSPSTETGAPSLTVGVGSGVADLLLRQFSAAITPDLAERAEGSPHMVLAGSRPKNAAALLAAGQLLHLKEPEGVDAGRPLHALVLEVDAEAKGVLIVPFSPIPIPATEAELATDLEDEALRVLCLWNARRIPAALAVKSWQIGQAGATLMADALALRAALARKEAPPAGLATRTGPPLSLADDRQAYLDEEDALWSKFRPDE